MLTRAMPKPCSATADGRVEALADQVHLTIVEMPVRGNGREAPQELTEHWHNVTPTEDRAHADEEGPKGVV